MARTFRFALLAVLEHRTRVADEKKRLVARCRQACNDAERERDRLEREFRSHRNGLGDVAQLQLLERAIVTYAAVLAECRAAFEQARKELIVAERARGAIECLEARGRAAFEAASRRREALELDDANARLHDRARTQRGGTA